MLQILCWRRRLLCHARRQGRKAGKVFLALFHGSEREEEKRSTLEAREEEEKGSDVTVTTEAEEVGG